MLLRIAFILFVIFNLSSCTTSKYSNPDVCNEITLKKEKITCMQELIAYMKDKYKPKIKHVYINGSNISKQNIHIKKYYNNWIKLMMDYGNANLPIAGRNIKTKLSVLVDVAINQDGTVYDIRLIRRSNIHEIDDIILPLISQAAPFPSFPKEIKDDVDILHIGAPFIFSPKYETYQFNII